MLGTNFSEQTFNDLFNACSVFRSQLHCSYFEMNSKGIQGFFVLLAMAELIVRVMVFSNKTRGVARSNKHS